MRLSWYAETGVAVFSIWQGETCTGTFRVPITDLPRLVETLQRGPSGATAGQPGIPGSGPGQVEDHGVVNRVVSGAAQGPPRDPLTGNWTSAYPVPGPSADPGRPGNNLAGYGGSDGRPGQLDPLAYGGCPEPAARGGYDEPATSNGYTGYNEPATYSGYTDPDVRGGAAIPAASGGYPGPLERAGQALPAAHDGYRWSVEHGGQAASDAYGGGYPYLGEHGEQGGYREQALAAARSGYPEPAHYGVQPDPDDYVKQPGVCGRGGYPETGQHRRPTEHPDHTGYPQPTGGYPEPTGSGGNPGAWEDGGQPRSPARGYSPETGEYSWPTEPPGRGASRDPAASGGYPGNGELGAHGERSAADGYAESAVCRGYPDPGDHSGQAEPSMAGNEPGAHGGRQDRGSRGRRRYRDAGEYDRHKEPGTARAPAGTTPGPPRADRTSLLPAQADFGPPPNGMAPSASVSGRSYSRGSVPPYPPDPNLDGEYPISGYWRTRDGRPQTGEPGASGSRPSADGRPADERPADERPADERPADERPADERPRTFPYGYPPVGDH